MTKFTSLNNIDTSALVVGIMPELFPNFFILRFASWSSSTISKSEPVFHRLYRFSGTKPQFGQAQQHKLANIDRRLFPTNCSSCESFPKRGDTVAEEMQRFAKTKLGMAAGRFTNRSRRDCVCRSADLRPMLDGQSSPSRVDCFGGGQSWRWVKCLDHPWKGRSKLY